MRLERVLEAEGGEGVIVFARTRAVTLDVAEALETLGHEVAVLNGEVPQAQRERTIERLRDGRVDGGLVLHVGADRLRHGRLNLADVEGVDLRAEFAEQLGGGGAHAARAAGDHDFLALVSQYIVHAVAPVVPVV